VTLLFAPLWSFLRFFSLFFTTQSSANMRCMPVLWPFCVSVRLSHSWSVSHQTGHQYNSCWFVNIYTYTMGVGRISQWSSILYFFSPLFRFPLPFPSLPSLPCYSPLSWLSLPRPYPLNQLGGLGQRRIFSSGSQRSSASKHIFAILHWNNTFHNISQIFIRQKER